MAEGAVVPTEFITGPIVGRSLWVEARVRLVRNRAALTSIVVLGFVALACIFGPFVTGHPFDRVYPDYVRAPASLSTYPTPGQVEPAIERIGARVRAKAENIEIGRNQIRMNLVGQRPIDERLLAYFERSDLFGPAKVVERLDEGRTLVIDVPVKRTYFLFGTDANGRDLLTRTMKAGQISLAIGLLATFVSILIGVVYGATSGYLGGRVDLIMMRIVDVLYSLPFIFFVIMLVVFFGRNFILMFIAVGAVEWLDMARIVRGQTLSIKRQEYVQAAEALGVETRGIIRRHVIPNTLGPVVVYMTLLVPKVILLESFLSFLGLGVQEPATSLGVLISEGAKNIQGATWMLLYPSLTLVTILFCLNFIGDGLRDALDPKDR
ncbi:ABC transporter permease subunit [Microvirga brassicacearum]|uniref:Oligopeptide transport system permease protein OppC n=1 Tax=Microvirga brassicacearum TaxID=2580413 RepID=A0A5N3PB41_9HYPH|nr:ABC transporter permease subunit [Microvirga brassicacearum]KAB0266957.1 ABC transporter permease subunit [Microvirga brassicacearum]